MTDFHEAIGQDVLEESADTLAGVEMSRAWTCTAGFTGGEGDGAVCEAHDTSVGDSDPEDIRSEGGAGRVSVVIGLTVDIPGDGPALRIDVFQQSSCVHLLFPQSAVDGWEGFHRDKEVGSGGQPRGAVLGEATARDDRVDVRMGLKLSSPGMQDTGKTRESGADEPLVCREPFACPSRGGEQGVVCEALMRADKRAQGLRDGEGEEEVRAGQLFLQVSV
jgi:hypothetical protein